jgi:hypothetical protein
VEDARSTQNIPVSGDSACLAREYASRLTPPREDTIVATPAKTITCPNCGLVLRVTRDTSGPQLLYDFKDWAQRCKRPDLEDPAWCLVRHGTKPGNQ